eukprot:2823373-Prorocentrum_lima.AAC.1
MGQKGVHLAQDLLWQKRWKNFEKKRHRYSILVKAVGCKAQKLFTSGLLASVTYGMDIAGTTTAGLNKLLTA